MIPEELHISTRKLLSNPKKEKHKTADESEAEQDSELQKVIAESGIEITETMNQSCFPKKILNDDAHLAKV